MSEFPEWTGDDAGDAEALAAVRWDELPDDWRTRDRRVVQGDRAEHANIVRALVAEGLAPVSDLGFADFLDRGGVS